MRGWRCPASRRRKVMEEDEGEHHDRGVDGNEAQEAADIETGDEQRAFVRYSRNRIDPMRKPLMTKNVSTPNRPLAVHDVSGELKTALARAGKTGTCRKTRCSASTQRMARAQRRR